MNKSVLKSFLALCLVSSTAISSFAQQAEQNEEYQQGQAVQGSVKINRQKITESEIARRDQLLKQSVLLQENYANTLTAVNAAQIKLNDFEQKCKIECTSKEMRELLNSVNEISSITLTGAIIANGLRWLITGMESFGGVKAGIAAEQFNRATVTAFKPWKTRTGWIILTSLALKGLNKVAQDFIEAKDKNLLENLGSLKETLNAYQKELQTISRQITAINEAMLQVVKIQQATTVKQNVEVGYEK